MKVEANFMEVIPSENKILNLFFDIFVLI